MHRSFITHFVLLYTVFCTEGYADRFEFAEDRVYGPNDKSPTLNGVITKYAPHSLDGTGRLVLTYDDGPANESTAQLLDLLKEQKVTATFFILGNKITAQALPLVQRTFREGHLVGSHSWNHTDSRKQTEAQFKADLKKSLLAVKKIQSEVLPDQNETYFRFPFGAYGFQNGYHHMNVLQSLSQELFGENCINFAFWNIDSADYVPSITPQNMLATVQAHFEGGSAYGYQWIRSNGKKTLAKRLYKVTEAPKGGVVLMHDTNAKTIEATRLIIQWAKSKNIQIVALNRLSEYSFDGKRCEPIL